MNPLAMIKSVGAYAVALLFILAIGWIFRSGGEAERVSNERQNNAAGNKADDDRSAFDRCPVGMWDYGARKCRGAATGGRN